MTYKPVYIEYTDIVIKKNKLNKNINYDLEIYHGLTTHCFKDSYILIGNFTINQVVAFCKKYNIISFDKLPNGNQFYLRPKGLTYDIVKDIIINKKPEYKDDTTMKSLKNVIHYIIK